MNAAMNEKERSMNAALVIALCRMDPKNREGMLRRAYGILDDICAADELARQTIERERLRVFAETGCHVVPVPGGDA